MDASGQAKVDLADVFKHLLHEITEGSSVVSCTLVSKPASKRLLVKLTQVDPWDVAGLSEQLLKKAFSLVMSVHLDLDFFLT